MYHSFLLSSDAIDMSNSDRYIQLPINAGMLEAVTEPWQVIATEAGSRRMTLLKAASELGVGVFASGPLGEGGLLQNQKIKACHHLQLKLSRQTFLQFQPIFCPCHP